MSNDFKKGFLTGAGGLLGVLSIPIGVYILYLLYTPTIMSLQKKEYLNWVDCDSSTAVEIINQAFNEGLDGKEYKAPPVCEVHVVQYGDKNYSKINYVSGDCFVFGSESKGLPNSVTNKFQSSTKIFIPMALGSRSINLANAVSIVIYEALRQRQFQFL